VARIRTKRIGGSTYYYVEHSIREGGKVYKKEVYLGKKIPRNVEEIKERLRIQLYMDKWHPLLDRIRESYAREARLMPSSAKAKELDTFAIRFTYDTQRIEGSTLTLKETASLLERGVTPRNRPVGDVREAEAHRRLFYEMLEYKKDLSLNVILEWHEKLFEETKPDIAGRIRKSRVGIPGSRFTPPLAVEVYPMLQDFFRWYGKSKDKLHPVELAALVHLKFVTIHPFADGNGRMSRLMMNFVLKSKGYPMLNIPYEGRNSYYGALERAQTGKMDDIFVSWFMRRYIKAHNTYLCDS
jgi:Fic family protein